MSRKVKILNLSKKMIDTPRMRRSSFGNRDEAIGTIILNKFNIENDHWYKIIQSFNDIREIIGVARGDNVAALIISKNEYVDDLSIFSIEKIPEGSEIIYGAYVTKNKSHNCENIREGVVNDIVLESTLYSKFYSIQNSRNFSDFAYLKKFVQKPDGTSVCISLI